MCAKKSLALFLPVLVWVAASIAIPNAVWATVVISGDVTPSTSGSWNPYGTAYVGKTADGTVEINSGDDLTSGGSYIGYNSGVGGTVTVTDPGSTWTTGYLLQVGYDGEGTLKIRNGGVVNSSNSDCRVNGYFSNHGVGSWGLVEVDGSGSTWTCKSLLLGYYGEGILNITNGGTVISNGLTIAGYYGAGAGTGTVTVDGVGSTWTSSSSIAIGHAHNCGTLNLSNGGVIACNDLKIGSSSGIGTLNVTSGGTVNSDLYFGSPTGSTGTANIANGALVVNGRTYVTYDYGTQGTVSFTGSNGTLTTKGLYLPANALTGTGTIHTNGLVGDLDLSFDSTHGASQTFAVGDVTVNLDMSNSNDVDNLGVGYFMDSGVGGGSGSLTIQDDVVVYSATGYLGYQYGSSGTATVTGPGSKWNNNEALYVGCEGSGTLSIQNGAEVAVAGPTYVAFGPSSAGTVNLDNGTLTTQGLWTETSNLTGAGTINTRGLVSDVDLTFDSTSGASGSFSVNGSVTLNLNLSQTSGNGDLGMGYADSSALTVQDGQKIYSAGGYLGYKDDTTAGTATITGSGSEWNNSSNLYLGYKGYGELNINAGGAVSNAIGYLGYEGSYSVGYASVDGSTSTWTNNSDLYVGYQGYGTLNIQNGATVSDATAYIGYNSSAHGTVTVDGSTWTNNGDLYVGHTGRGTLAIDGGSVSVAGSTYFGYKSSYAGKLTFGAGGGTLSTGGLYLKPSKYDFSGAGVINTHGIVADLDMVFDNSNQFTTTINSVTVNVNMDDPAKAGDLGVGYTGAHSLTITNGATVYSATGILGYENVAFGTATVTGATWSNSGIIYVGGSSVGSSGGKGVLNIGSGGTVSTAGIAKGAYWMTNGTVNFDGGTLQANTSSTSFMTGLTNAYIKANGATIDTNGYDITIGQTLKTDTVSTGGGLTKTGGGTLVLNGSNTYTGRTILEAGTLELGASAQSVILTGGGADIQAGKMTFKYSSTAPDVLTPLAASYTGGTAPWTTGQFLCTTTGGTDTTHGLGWIDNGVDEITVMYTLYGDSNCDGSVNGTDLNAVLSYYNQSSQVWGNGDFNYDGSVNGTDLNTVLSNYNQSLSSSTAAVPEPSTLLLALAGLASLLAYLRSKRK